MGHTVLGKTICLDYKTKKRRKAKEDELIIFKNTHEATGGRQGKNRKQQVDVYFNFIGNIQINKNK